MRGCVGEVVKFPPHAGQSYVSPYLLRPLRRVEEVEEARRRILPGEGDDVSGNERAAPQRGAPVRE
jgi:hypothetical protein